MTVNYILMYFRAIITWLFFLPVPIINGFLREKWYKAVVGETAAHQIGTLVVSSVFFIYAYISLKDKISVLNNVELLKIGLLWLIMTVFFEFGLGLAGGRSWEYMLADYNIIKGRIWVLVLLTVFTSPFLVKFVTK